MSTVNEVIVTGRVKRRLIDKAAKLWQRLSYWTKASDVEFDDGKTAEEKVGNINGITSDIDDDSEDIAASSALTHETHERINELTDNGKIVSINIDESGNPYIKYKDGADTVSKKLGSGTVMYLGKGKSFNVSNVYNDYKNLTANNFIVEIPDPKYNINSPSAIQIKEQDLNLFAGATLSLTKKYTASTGKLEAYETVTATAGFSESGTTGTEAKAIKKIDVNAYLVAMPLQNDQKDDTTKTDTI